MCSRMATNASCSRARSRVCAWTLPVATHGTPSALGERGEAAVAARGRGAWNGRCSSTRQRVAPERARAAAAASARRGRRWRAQPLRQTRPSACSLERRRASRTPRGASRRSAGALVGRPARVRVRAGEQPAEVAPAARVADEQREVPARRLGVVRGGSPSTTSTSAPWIACSAERLGRLRELHRAREPSCGRSARAPRARARAAAATSSRAARRRRGTRRRSARGARRTACEHMFADRGGGSHARVPQLRFRRAAAWGAAGRSELARSDGGRECSPTCRDPAERLRVEASATAPKECCGCRISSSQRLSAMNKRRGRRLRRVLGVPVDEQVWARSEPARHRPHAAPLRPQRVPRVPVHAGTPPRSTERAEGQRDERDVIRGPRVRLAGQPVPDRDAGAQRHRRRRDAQARAEHAGRSPRGCSRRACGRAGRR